jgi:TPR repeat protein
VYIYIYIHIYIGNLLAGDMYMGGYTISKNLNHSAVCYERAANNGNVLGMERLALLLISGYGVTGKDSKRAIQLMTHALSQISSGYFNKGVVQVILKQLVNLC